MGFRDRLVSRLGYELEPAYVPETENRGVANTAPAREAVSVTPTTALSLVAVSRATSVLETAVMQIPVNVYRGNTQLPTPLWLETPDIENQISQAEWLGTTLIHMAIFGNAYWHIRRGPRGIVNITNLHPSDRKDLLSLQFKEIFISRYQTSKTLSQPKFIIITWRRSIAKTQISFAFST